MTKLCSGCGGPVCPTCGGCINEGECGCRVEYAGGVAVLSTAGPLELRTMGDPCPRCGGTDYYCAEEAYRHIEHLLSQNQALRVTLRESQDRADRFLKLAQKYEGEKYPACIDRAEAAEAEAERLRAALAQIVTSEVGQVDAPFCTSADCGRCEDMQDIARRALRED